MNAVAIEPVHGLETPYPFQPQQNYFQLSGWAFLPGTDQPSACRLVINGKAHAPAETLERPDVAARYAAEPQARRSGFRFLVYLPFGLHAGQLEVNAGNGWIVVRRFIIPVSSHPLLGAVEKPTAENPITRPTRIEGWCFHPEFKVREVVLQFGNVEVPCLYGLERPDVAARFPESPSARQSGFITDENLPRGSGGVKIRALTECGRVYFSEAAQTVDIKEGWIPKPPPPSPLPEPALPALDPCPPIGADAAAAGRAETRRNMLFVLYGDFSANSALHVASLANEFVGLGYDCVVAVPEHKRTVAILPHCRFKAVEFADAAALPRYFRDGRGPDLIHAWTTRENVRQFTTQTAERHRSKVFVHLEDNEHEILESRLHRPFTELETLDETELTGLIPPTLSHPRRAAEFLAQANGVTVIVERLREHVPAGRPCHTVWPAADPLSFFPRERDEALRAKLGFRPDDVVLFYHGNTHTSNAEEVGFLYGAVGLLNDRGIRTQLIRTGRDFPGFLERKETRIPRHLVHAGHVSRPKYLGPLMAMADYFVQPGLPGAFNDYRFPSKLPEFFAIGRPVILPASNLGTLVRHGEDAWVLPRADAPGIADAIAHLHGDRTLGERLARGAREYAARHFSWERSARGLLEFYRTHVDLAPPRQARDAHA